MKCAEGYVESYIVSQSEGMIATLLMRNMCRLASTSRVFRSFILQITIVSITAKKYKNLAAAAELKIGHKNV